MDRRNFLKHTGWSLVGGGLMVAAIVLLVTKKRMENK